MNLSRPAETIQAALSSILGAALIIFGAVKDGFDVTDLNAEVIGAISLVVGFAAAIVTHFVAKKQRDATDPTGSAADGAVTRGE